MLVSSSTTVASALTPLAGIPRLCSSNTGEIHVSVVIIPGGWSATRLEHSSGALTTIDPRARLARSPMSVRRCSWPPGSRFGPCRCLATSHSAPGRIRTCAHGSGNPPEPSGGVRVVFRLGNKGFAVQTVRLDPIGVSRNLGQNMGHTLVRTASRPIVIGLCQLLLSGPGQVRRPPPADACGPRLRRRSTRTRLASLGRGQPC